MKRKKIITLLMTIVMLISALSLTAFAKNNHDVEFSYSMPNEGYYRVYGVGQRKEDASGSYVYSYSSNPAAAVITLYTEDTHHHLQMDIPTAQKTIPQLSMQGKKDVLDNMYTNGDIHMRLSD